MNFLVRCAPLPTCSVRQGGHCNNITHHTQSCIVYFGHIITICRKYSGTPALQRPKAREVDPTDVCVYLYSPLACPFHTIHEICTKLTVIPCTGSISPDIIQLHHSKCSNEFMSNCTALFVIVVYKYNFDQTQT